MVKIYKNLGAGNKIVKFIRGCGPNGIGIISFFGCNFKCPLCFAQKYSYQDQYFQLDSNRKTEVTPEDIANSIIEFIDKHPNLCYIQLTGGEPNLNENRITQIVQSLKILDYELGKKNRKIRIIYQTNGYFIGQKDSDYLKNLFQDLLNLKNIFILFEVSIKGTNKREFELLSGIKNAKGFEYQLKSYWLLKELITDKIQVVARLGFGHHRNTLHLINPENGESLFLRKNWDEKFEEVFEDTTKRMNQTRMIAECINAEGDGGVNNYVHRSIPAIARGIRKGILATRTYSLAIETACKKFDINCTTYQNSLMTDHNYEEDYKEFSKYFKCMGDPASAYCGRNEFSLESREECKGKCIYYKE